MSKVSSYLSLTLTLFVVAIFTGVSARCYHDIYQEYQFQQDASLRERLVEQESAMRTAQQGARQSSTIYTIPTVVHIIYNTDAQNIDDGHIIDQIARMNIDFRKLNADGATTVSNFKPLAADSGIQFVLATTDPTGAATNGITRTSTTRTVFPQPGSVGFANDCKFSVTGGYDGWNTKKYMNIWVCPLGGNNLGYTQAPGGTNVTDGVVITSNAFGVQINNPSYDLGRTVTHEVGHWFNLLHPWGKNESDCYEDDLIPDTPQTFAANYGCNLEANSCGNLNMVQNFMDYSDDDCMTIFTTEQVARMRAELDTGGRRTAVAITDYQGEVIGLNNYVSPYAVPGSSASSIVFGWALVVALLAFL